MSDTAATLVSVDEYLKGDDHLLLLFKSILVSELWATVTVWCSCEGVVRLGIWGQFEESVVTTQR